MRDERPSAVGVEVIHERPEDCTACGTSDVEIVVQPRRSA
jgi:hypothetical protein